MAQKRSKAKTTVGPGPVFWAGRGASAFGTTLTTLAITFFAAVVLKLDPLAISTIASGAFIATLLSPLYAGVLADSLDRRQLSAAADAARAIIVVGVAVAVAIGRCGVVELALANMCLAGLEAISNSSFRAGFPDIVGEAQLIKGNSRLQTINTLADTGGGIVGGAAVSLFGPVVSFAANAVAYGFSAISLWSTRWPNSRSSSALVKPSYSWRVRRGFIVIWRDKTLRALVFTSTSSTFFISISSMALLWFMVREIGFSYFSYTVVLSVGSAGAVLGAIICDRVTVFLRTEQRAQVASLGIYATMLVAYTFLTDSTLYDIVFAAGFDFVIGVAISLYVINNSTQQQRIVRTTERGSVSAVRIFGNALAAVAGTAISGWLIHAIEGRGSVLVSGIGVGTVAMVFGVWILVRRR